MTNFSHLEGALKPQAREVLRLLRSAGERGVTNGDFIRAYIERFGGRIFELRKAGWGIDKEREEQGRYRYFLRAEPAGVGAEVLGLMAVSADPGGTPIHRPESDSEALVGVGGDGPPGEGSLFDADQFAAHRGYADSELVT
jgi:hypothetical protein